MTESPTVINDLQRSTPGRMGITHECQHSIVDSITRKGNVVARPATAISTLENYPSLKQTPAAAARLEATRKNTGA